MNRATRSLFQDGIVLLRKVGSILAEAGEEAGQSVGLRVSLPGETGEGETPIGANLPRGCNAFRVGYRRGSSSVTPMSVLVNAEYPPAHPGGEEPGPGYPCTPPAAPDAAFPGYRHPGPVSGVNPGIKPELDPPCSPLVNTRDTGPRPNKV